MSYGHCNWDDDERCARPVAFCPFSRLQEILCRVFEESCSCKVKNFLNSGFWLWILNKLYVSNQISHSISRKCPFVAIKLPRSVTLYSEMLPAPFITPTRRLSVMQSIWRCRRNFLPKFYQGNIWTSNSQHHPCSFPLPIQQKWKKGFVEYWIASNETNTDVHMYTWRIYSGKCSHMLYKWNNTYGMEITLVYIQTHE